VEGKVRAADRDVVISASPAALVIVRRAAPQRFVGTLNRDIDASELIVDFFSRH
jgi:hypothetical protein